MLDGHCERKLVSDMLHFDVLRGLRSCPFACILLIESHFTSEMGKVNRLQRRGGGHGTCKIPIRSFFFNGYIQSRSELAGVRLVDVPEFQILQVPVAAPSKA